MLRTLSFALLLVACACKDKGQEPAKQTPAAPEPAPAPDRAAVWRDRVPALERASALKLERASGIVEIAADGLLAATANPAEPAKPVELDALARTFGFAPIAPRRDMSFAPAESDGGASTGLENPIDAKFARLGHPATASGAPEPAKRLTTAFSIAHPSEVNGGILVLADASAPAAVLVDVLARVGGFVAVRAGDKLAALPLAVDRSPPAATRPDRGWAELRLDTPVELEHVPSTPVRVAAADGLAAALGTLGTDAIDVLVASDTRVGDLVRVVDQLRAANVDAIGFGRAPAAGTADANARRQTGPRVVAWDFAIGGGGKVDAAPFRAAFDATLGAIRACFIKAAKAKSPQVAHVRFVVPEKGKVTRIEVTGAEPPVAACTRDTIKAATFPSALNLPVEARIAFDRGR